MFRAVIATFAALVISSAFAAQGDAPRSGDRLRLKSGVMLFSWKVISETPTTLTLRHSEGAQKVQKRDLPEELAKHYPIDSAAAAEEEKDIASGKAEFEKRKAEASKLQAIAAMENQRELEAAREKRRQMEISRQERRDEAIAARLDAKEIDRAVAQATNEDVEKAMLDHVKRHFGDARIWGVNASVVRKVDVEMGEISPTPGWRNRFQCEGAVRVDFSDSWGVSVGSRSAKWACEVERSPTGWVKVTSLTVR